MRMVLALFVSALLLFISAVHVYWAAGGTRGMNLVLPQREGMPVFTPPAWLTAGVALGLLAAAGVALLAGMPWLLPAIPPVAKRGLVGALSVIFALRTVGDFRLVGLFRRVTDTPFAHWDARLFTPLCLLLSVACALLSW